jgi:hypothetical protein
VIRSVTYLSTVIRVASNKKKHSATWSLNSLIHFAAGRSWKTLDFRGGWVMLAILY